MSTRSPSQAMARVNTFAFSGIDAVPVEVQVQITGGMPTLMLVGLPDPQRRMSQYPHCLLYTSDAADE